MATSQDFDDLIVRINTATDKLETATLTIEGGADAVQDGVQEAQQAASDAQQAVLDAQAQADLAGTSAQAADSAYQDAVAIVTDFENTYLVGEAPENGNEYVRKNGQWVLNTGGTVGAGDVLTVNNVPADEEGNVEILPADVGALEDTYTPSWSDLEGKPTLSTVATTGAYEDLTGTPSVPTKTSDLDNNSDFISDAPVDTEQYVRQGGSWKIVNIPEGGAGPYPIPNNQALKEGGEFLTEWTSDNPHDAADTGLIGFRDSSTGSYIDASALLEGSSPEPERFSSGQYYFGTDVFTKALQGHSGVIYVNSQSNENLITAITNPADGDGAKFFVYNKSETDFEEVGGGSSGGGGGGFTFSESGFYYDGTPITEWPETNPHKAISIEKCGARVSGVWKEGAELFSTSAGIRNVPEGPYTMTSSPWPSDGSPLAGHYATIEIKDRARGKQAVAYVFNVHTDDIGIHILQYGRNNEWVTVAQKIV